MDCFNCELFEENLTENLKQAIHKKLSIPLGEICCQGCRVQNGKHFHLSKDGQPLIIVEIPIDQCVETRGQQYVG